MISSKPPSYESSSSFPLLNSNAPPTYQQAMLMEKAKDIKPTIMLMVGKINEISNNGPIASFIYSDIKPQLKWQETQQLIKSLERITVEGNFDEIVKANKAAFNGVDALIKTIQESEKNLISHLYKHQKHPVKYDTLEERNDRIDDIEQRINTGKEAEHEIKIISKHSRYLAEIVGDKI
ncbi:Uncharacterised protein [Yersinia nurmii]|uniref:Uncharacterized protein n=1 Tax=Yersinia nurmii TaxID=685706 RepID=A0ABM9SHB4_9GAMM|nr:hypothetical protein [Yersinia nurmii]CNE61087.1 Uncharacterised protein [Yersinia nurmii]